VCDENMTENIGYDGLSLCKIEIYAKKQLSKNAYEYFAGGSCNEISLKANRAAYDDIFLIPRILKDVFHRDLSTVILNDAVAMPVIIAPMSYQGLAHQDGEIATAKAAKLFKVIMTLSTLSNNDLESVSEVNPELLWFQLYILNDRMLTLDLIKRAEASNCKALVVTVDSQFLGIRNMSRPFKLPAALKNANFTEDDAFLKLYRNNDLFDKTITWKDIEWLKANTTLPIIIKGILSTEDAKIAVENEIDGLVVSNHGGRQLDTSVPPIFVLPRVAEIVSNKLLLLIDGGIRRGTDILKAIAMGADAVLIGRPILWGLSAYGTDGVIDVLNIFKEEFDNAMALSGFSSIQQLKNKGSDIIYGNNL
jgi:4-hydroxymandelate oxidase